MSRRRKILTIAAIVTVIVLALVVVGALLTSLYFADRVLPNTVVSGLNLSGKTQEEAKNIIVSRSQKIVNQSLTLQLNEQSAVVTPAQLGVKIDVPKTLNTAIPTIGQWDWLTPRYWQLFFSEKNLVFSYEIDGEVLRQTLDEKLPVVGAPKDAAIIVKNGQLEAELATTGITIDMDALENNIKAIVERGPPPEPIAVDFTKLLPDISTEAAQAAIAEVNASIQPIPLVIGETNITLQPRDIAPYITFNRFGGRFLWQLDQAGAERLVAERIAPRVNIRMKQRTIMTDTGAVTYPGQEGRTVQNRALASVLAEAINNRNFPSAEMPIAIPVAPIAITDRMIAPKFVPGLFAGRYITVNLAEQMLFLIEGHQKVASFRISSGKWSTPTPTGTFYIINRFEMSFSRPFRVWMPKWLGLAPNPDGSGYLGYGIHGLPCYTRDCSVRDGINQLGQAVSAGCIRLGDEGASFVFNWAPIGTPVVIH